MDLKTKIDEYNQTVTELKEKLAQAQESHDKDQINTYTDRLKNVAYARYAIKSLYVETICKQLDIDLDAVIKQVDSHLDISKISDEYDVFVIAKKK
jgi:hypothetical protein